MGNQPQGTRRLSKPTRYSRNSYSFDGASLMSHRIENLPSERGRERPAPTDSITASLMLPQQQNDTIPSSPLQLETMQRSLTNPQILASNKTKVSNDQRLSELNAKNDKLRKELIKISSELTTRLGKKKYEEKKKEREDAESDKVLPALKRELENGYKQISRYKKLVEELRAKEVTNNQDVLNEMQSKLIEVDNQITQANNEIEAAKNIDKNQLIMIKKSQSELDNAELKELKAEVDRLRNKLKSDYKIERKKAQKEKILQEYMFQLERRWREVNGDYLPDIKSYANKNYQPEPKTQKKKKEELLHKPEKWEIKDLLDQLRTLKEKHQDYHLKIQKALKVKNTVREQNEKLKQDLENAQKQIEALRYKKDRYLQLVMGNIQFLMNEEEEEIEISKQEHDGGVRAIIKGNDVPDQTGFDDHAIVQKVPSSQLRIVSVNVWYTEKRQISVIQMIYFDGKECLLGGKTANTTGDMEKDKLELEEGDYIKNVMGSFNRKGAIEFLAFNSIKGKAKQFGKQIMNGLNFTFGVTRRQRPICMSGFTFFDGTYWRINKLVLDVTYL